jgi:hypothetical protein
VIKLTTKNNTTKYYNGKLLSDDSAKIKHSNRYGETYKTKIMYLAPSNLSGKNVCPFASTGCASACLNTAGLGGVYQSIQDSRINRTNFFFNHKQEFFNQLVKEIKSHVTKCNKDGFKPAIRLNGTSDLAWELIFPELFTMFPDVIWYDYTKFPINKRTRLPKNYSLTFSRSESNHDQVLENLENGRNVAVVFSTKKGQDLPSQYLGYPVIDGDLHDMRFLDPKGVVVGLRGKGKAMNGKDNSGFVVEVV